jgi:hypothetical protein
VRIGGEGGYRRCGWCVVRMLLLRRRRCVGGCDGGSVLLRRRAGVSGAGVGCMELCSGEVALAGCGLQRRLAAA